MFNGVQVPYPRKYTPPLEANKANRLAQQQHRSLTQRIKTG